VVAVGDGKMLESGQKAPLTVKAGTRFYFASTQAPRSKLMVRNISFFVKMMFLAIVED